MLLRTSPGRFTSCLARNAKSRENICSGCPVSDQQHREESSFKQDNNNRCKSVINSDKFTLPHKTLVCTSGPSKICETFSYIVSRFHGVDLLTTISLMAHSVYGPYRELKCSSTLCWPTDARRPMSRVSMMIMMSLLFRHDQEPHEWIMRTRPLYARVFDRETRLSRRPPKRRPMWNDGCVGGML